MSLNKPLRWELAAIVSSLRASGSVIDPLSIAADVINGHAKKGLRKNQDGDWFRGVAYPQVREELRKLINSWKLKGDMPDQLGFMEIEQAQAYYTVHRNGRDQFVPILQMTYDEFTGKMDEHEKKGLAQLQHSRELRRIRDLLFGGQGTMPLDEAA
ncbi:MAG: hypothetical protein GDA50_04025 [Alphaproteobacteria bacterium GM202ARS2]|nr:hypothetical protein [Alphaproteobacteria bacterium GM202ARS2]